MRIVHSILMTIIIICFLRIILIDNGFPNYNKVEYTLILLIGLFYLIRMFFTKTKK